MKRDAKHKDTNKSKTHHGYKSIRLPFSKKEYSSVSLDNSVFKILLNKYIKLYPWLFPVEIQTGYYLYGYCPQSKKQDICVRRIQVKATKEVYQIFPSFVMPYMTELTEVAEKILLLMEYNVPTEVLSYVFNLNNKHLERLEAHLGKCSIVGSSISGKMSIPTDLLADEKHSRMDGRKVFVANTVAKNMFLGAEVSADASEKGLLSAYTVFSLECQDIDEDYTPKTVNTDGWLATGNAFRRLFPSILVIFCFLHAILSIKNSATKKTLAIFNEVKQLAWNIYRSENAAIFTQLFSQLREWTKDCSDGKIAEKVNKMCDRESNFKQYYSHQTAHRTSNMIDRLMNYLDKFLYLNGYLHGSLSRASNTTRVHCLLYNFKPYAKKTLKKKKACRSAFEQFNGFQYHDNWLQNLLVATSRNGFRNFQQKKG